MTGRSPTYLATLDTNVVHITYPFAEYRRRTTYTDSDVRLTTVDLLMRVVKPNETELRRPSVYNWHQLLINVILCNIDISFCTSIVILCFSRGYNDLVKQLCL